MYSVNSCRDKLFCLFLISCFYYQNDQVESLNLPKGKIDIWNQDSKISCRGNYSKKLMPDFTIDWSYQCSRIVPNLIEKFKIDTESAL